MYLAPTGIRQILLEIKLREFFPAEPGRIFERGLRYALRIALKIPVFIKRKIATIQKFGAKTSACAQSRLNLIFLKYQNIWWLIQNTWYRHKLQTPTAAGPLICIAIWDLFWTLHGIRVLGHVKVEAKSKKQNWPKFTISRHPVVRSIIGSYWRSGGSFVCAPRFQRGAARREIWRVCTAVPN